MVTMVTMINHITYQDKKWIINCKHGDLEDHVLLPESRKTLVPDGGEKLLYIWVGNELGGLSSFIMIIIIRIMIMIMIGWATNWGIIAIFIIIIMKVWVIIMRRI